MPLIAFLKLDSLFVDTNAHTSNQSGFAGVSPPLLITLHPNPTSRNLISVIPGCAQKSQQKFDLSVLKTISGG